MESILLVSSSEKGRSAVSQLLTGAGQVYTAANGSEARRILSQTDFSLIVINAPLIDEPGHELAVMITENSTAGVILLVKCDLADELSDRLEPYGVFVVGKPLNRALFYQAVRLTLATRNRLLGLRSENIKLQTKIEEIRLIDRAKCALIQYLKMTEPQAHRYIEKQAMDMRKTRREVAENILKTYEV